MDSVRVGRPAIRIASLKRPSRGVCVVSALISMGFSVPAHAQTPPPAAPVVPAVHRLTDAGKFEFFEAHSLPAPQGAKAVLVLINDPAKPRAVLDQPLWMDFARQEKLAVLSVGFQFKPGLRDRLAMGDELAAKIDEAVIKAYGKDRKCIGFAQGWGAEWLLRAMQAKPDRWSFWCSKGASIYPFAPRNLKETKLPPGIVISQGPEQYEPARRYFLDLRRLGPLDQKVTFVGSERDTLDGTFLDRFFHQYVSAVLNARVDGPGYWQIYYGGENAPAEGKDPSIDFSWLPNAELVGAWRLLNREAKPPAPVETRVETFPTPVGDQKVWVRIPGSVSKDKQPVRGVLLWLTRAADDEAMDRNVRNFGDPVMAFADLNRIPVLAWNVQGVWPHTYPQLAADAKEEEVAVADGSFIKIGDALYDRLREYCRTQGWPDQNWLLSADTNAGRYGLMMAQAYPFLAAQLHSASGYADLVAPPKVPWLVTVGWGDPALTETFKFAQKARSEFLPVVFKRCPGMGYGNRWDQRTLAAEFFSHILWLRDGGGATLPWLADWNKPPLPPEFRTPAPVPAPAPAAATPASSASSDPEEKKSDTPPSPPPAPVIPPGVDLSKYAPDRPKPVTLGEWFAEECRRTYLGADWRQLKLAEVQEQKWIAPWYHTRMPTREIAEAWALTETAAVELTDTEKESIKKHQDTIRAQDAAKTAALTTTQATDPKTEKPKDTPTPVPDPVKPADPIQPTESTKPIETTPQ